MKSDWRINKLSEVIDFNPKLKLPKGQSARKISMDCLQPFTKHVNDFNVEKYNGGMKFENGDTIMARITPCLENGKTAFIDVLDDGEVGFGSTEYIVWRAKEGLADPQYVYYLATSPKIREVAIKSMVGSSGRQRVQQSVLEEHELLLPPYNEQVAIGRYLAMLDEKIKVNEQVNVNLLQQLQVFYQLMFGKASQGSETEWHLSDICAYSQRRVAVSSLSLESYYSTENMLPGKAGAVAASSLPTIAQTTGCKPGDILISNIRPYFKKIVYVQSECGCSTDVLCFVPMTSDLSPYLYSTLYNDHFFDYMVAGSKGTKMPRGDKQQIMAYPIVLPSQTQLAEFNAIAQPILARIEAGKQENKHLASMRDTLLPKLMSGEIDVSSIDI